MSVIKEDMLIIVNSDNNNNKFYHMKLNSDNSIDIEYGRVGNSGQKTSKTGGEHEYIKVICECIVMNNNLYKVISDFIAAKAA